jgi:chromosome segregation ATPase
MRYLSKIIFINSADKSLKYAEIDLDGNVHFIGTQGVGKSTLLRAILFFYNADTQKLGIPREKKNYNEYYFPYQNSYIIYEIQTETGKFCVLSFKSQGRTAFRFIDSEYDKKFFIDKDGKAFETWDKTREALGKVDSTRIISNYEEYRNILYGNNKGLSNEFRKYALIESKQYQNIPRTIANVFLNAKLDAEFVKETIIKSLNEEEVKIDLTTYSQIHLKDFETNLTDIKKWTEGNVGNQAEKVTTTYSALKYLEQKKKDLAFQLGYSLNNVKEKQPRVQEQLNTEELKRDRVSDKLKELDNVFDKKKGEVQKEIGVVSNKLKEISSKRKEYEALKIETILERVAKKPTLDLEMKNLLEEKGILTSKFTEIQKRYEAQLRQLENQIKEFENNIQTEKNTTNSNFIHFKDELNKQYEVINEDIRKQHKEELETANANLKEKSSAIIDNKIKLSEIKHKRFYETEISNCKTEISNVKSAISKADTDNQQANDKIKIIQKEWEFEEKNIKADTNRKIERKTEEQEAFNKQIVAIDTKIENSKNSLYGWLNENIPDWDKTIGKVIDEENVLFQQGLNPKKISDTDLSFYGISIDTSEINKSVKTVADLQNEQVGFKKKIEEIKQAISNINVQSNDELEKLKRKFQPKIKEQKEIIQKSDYTKENSKTKLDELKVRQTEFEKKAKAEQKTAIENIEAIISKLSEEKTEAEDQIHKIEGKITKTIDTKKKEKEAKIKAEQEKVSNVLKQLDEQIQVEKKNVNTKSETIKANQNKELDTKGADTKRIDEINLRVSEIDLELNFIENNRDKVAEYNKDKRELFDKEDEFKNKKYLLDKQLENEAEKHNQQKGKFIQELGKHKAAIEAIKLTLSAYQKDFNAFESFTKTEVYLSVEQFISSFTNEHQTEQNCVSLTSELQTADNTITKRYVELQEAINKFTGNFQENNLFSFKVKFIDRTEYLDFAEMLKEFIDESKISEYKKRVEERFAHIIRQIGRETQSLIEKEGEISKIITEINNDFVSRQFVTAIKSVELKTIESKNRIFTLLVEIKNFNDENTFDLGETNLFSTSGQSNKNEKAISLLIQLIKEMTASKEKEITLSDSFELLFKIVENDNDTGWVEKLTNVGSEGTDILVKAMINIMLLNVFKEKASKKQKDDFRLHCMLDEIGKLHPNNVKGILKFANDRNILLINSSPTSLNATDYRYTYLLSKDSKNITSVKRLVRKITKMETQANA